ncbi:MAG: hypothetical protein WD696_22545 [Bryobacteraceae bacterium]
MAKDQITGQGLTTIAILVALLWGCLFLDRSLVRQARAQSYRALRDIRYLQIKKRIEPVSAPMYRLKPPSGRPVSG